MGPGKASAKQYIALQISRNRSVQQLRGTRLVPDGVERDLSKYLSSQCWEGPCNFAAGGRLPAGWRRGRHPDLADGLAFNSGTSQLPVMAGQRQTQQRDFTDDDTQPIWRA